MSFSNLIVLNDSEIENSITVIISFSLVTVSFTSSATQYSSVILSATDLNHLKHEHYVAWFWTTSHKFLNWWNETCWVKLNEAKRDNSIALKWDSTHRISSVWKEFIQVASVHDETSHVMCQHCEKILTHLQRKNTGTSIMSRHLQNSKTCFKWWFEQESMRRQFRLQFSTHQVSNCLLSTKRSL